MRKSIRLTIGASIAASLALAGCSSGGGDVAPPSNGEVGGKVTISFVATFKAALQPVVAQFEKKYPKAKVDVTYAGDDVLTATSTQLQAGTAPDIFLTLPGGVANAGGGMLVVTLASKNQLLDLSGSGWASAVPKVWKSDVSYQGKTYAYPGALQGLGAIYDLTTLGKLGLSVPEKWSDVLALCDAAKSKGKYAYAQGLSDGQHMIYLALTSTLVYGPHPDFTQQQIDGKATFLNSPWKEAFEKYVEMNKRGCFGEGALGRTQLQGVDAVARGKAFGAVGVGAGLAPIAKAVPNDKLTIAPFPATDNPADTYMPALPGFTISVNAKAKNPTAAKAFLDVLAQSDNINAYAAGFGSVPVIPNNKFTPPETLSTFNKFVATGKYTKLPTWPSAELQPLAMQEVQSMLLGKDSVDTALTKMQQKFDATK